MYAVQRHAELHVSERTWGIHRGLIMVAKLSWLQSSPLLRCALPLQHRARAVALSQHCQLTQAFLRLPALLLKPWREGPAGCS